ncbi:hypothetical protein D917_08621 [Trichinella nativa]|uniref:Uncharacterized protein n=2 Tax=Trichinella TaxID=6333 RepID=A0A1Y3EMZ8_9BILA|nr:hypothetical protein D917_08621 [Trichinella nativa]
MAGEIKRRLSHAVGTAAGAQPGVRITSTPVQPQKSGCC